MTIYQVEMKSPLRVFLRVLARRVDEDERLLERMTKHSGLLNSSIHEKDLLPERQAVMA